MEQQRIGPDRTSESWGFQALSCALKAAGDCSHKGQLCIVIPGENRKGKLSCGLASVEQTGLTFPQAKIIQSQVKQCLSSVFLLFHLLSFITPKHTQLYQLSLGILLCFLCSIKAFLAKIVVFWGKEPKTKMILLQLKVYHDSGFMVELALQGCRKRRGEAFKKTLI